MSKITDDVKKRLAKRIEILQVDGGFERKNSVRRI